jgi:hypothetical protein
LVHQSAKFLLDFADARAQQQKIVRGAKARMCDQLADAVAGRRLEPRLEQPYFADELRETRGIAAISFWSRNTRRSRIRAPSIQRHRIAVLGKTLPVRIPQQYRSGSRA